MPDNTNKSLYIYTGLIFLVAVILIIISFFGQSKLADTQPDPVSVEMAKSITERASALSAENSKLLEENIKLRQELSESQSDLIQTQSNLGIYKKSHENTALLLEANRYVSEKKYSKAKSLFENIDQTILTENEKIIYSNVKKAVENNDD